MKYDIFINIQNYKYLQMRQQFVVQFGFVFLYFSSYLFIVFARLKFLVVDEQTLHVLLIYILAKLYSEIKNYDRTIVVISRTSFIVDINLK